MCPYCTRREIKLIVQKIPDFGHPLKIFSATENRQKYQLKRKHATFLKTILGEYLGVMLRLLRQLSNNLTALLTFIIQKSWQNTKLLKDRREGCCTSIFKTEEEIDPDNCYCFNLLFSVKDSTGLKTKVAKYVGLFPYSDRETQSTS